MEVPRHWRLKKQRYALVGEVCPQCKSRMFPPREVCPYCVEQAKAAAQREPVLAMAETAHTAVR